MARRLEAAYGIPEPPPRQPVLDGLVRTLLSQQTTSANSRRAMARLRERLPTWRDVLEAGPADVAEAIRPAGLAATRAPRLQALLRQVLADHGELSLELLREWDTDRVRAYLVSLPGVGVKTAACVLLFDLARPELPVDTHVHRIALRLGWVPPGTSAERAYLRLNAEAPDAEKHSLHVNLWRHGRAVCRPVPRCAQCPLLHGCPHGHLVTAP